MNCFVPQVPQAAAGAPSDTTEPQRTEPQRTSTDSGAADTEVI